MYRGENNRTRSPLLGSPSSYNYYTDFSTTFAVGLSGGYKVSFKNTRNFFVKKKIPELAP